MLCFKRFPFAGQYPNDIYRAVQRMAILLCDNYQICYSTKLVFILRWNENKTFQMFSSNGIELKWLFSGGKLKFSNPLSLSFSLWSPWTTKPCDKNSVEIDTSLQYISASKKQQIVMKFHFSKNDLTNSRSLIHVWQRKYKQYLASLRAWYKLHWSQWKALIRTLTITDL